METISDILKRTAEIGGRTKTGNFKRKHDADNLMRLFNEPLELGKI